MTRLNLPEYPLNTKLQDDQTFIYDQFRKKYILLTPEEWVRQHFLNYLIEYLSYPRSLIKVEGGLHVNQLAKRSDILVYDQEVNPHMLIECKAANVKLNNKTFDQLSTYNQVIKAKYLVITNGLKHYCCLMDYAKNSYQFQQAVPAYVKD